MFSNYGTKKLASQKSFLENIALQNQSRLAFIFQSFLPDHLHHFFTNFEQIGK